jgi:hypothetical protein
MNNAIKLIHNHLINDCPEIHAVRLQSVMDIASALQKSQNLSMASMGRKVDSSSNIKNKIKKVDRLESNRHLHGELEVLYSGLSQYVFKYISYEASAPVIIDVCYLKDNCAVQMLSAEIALKGRSLPLYRDVFNQGELKKRASKFISTLKELLPSNKPVIIIMDAAFGEDWLKAIELAGWHWLVRIRQGKNIQLESNTEWVSVKDFIPTIGLRSKCYKDAQIMVKHGRRCRLVTVRKSAKKDRRKPQFMPRNDKAGNNSFRLSAKEPWILATNLPNEYNTTHIINLYKKRMQIEESFRDMKSHRFGLSGRYISTTCVYRWGVKMLLASIVQIVFWIIGVIGHSQNFQKVFQANTVKDKKVFSYFFLGQLIVEHDKLDELIIDYKNIREIIANELARDW